MRGAGEARTALGPPPKERPQDLVQPTAPCLFATADAAKALRRRSNRPLCPVDVRFRSVIAAGVIDDGGPGGGTPRGSPGGRRLADRVRVVPRADGGPGTTVRAELPL
ncbi:hypothetical protein GCM10010233_48350 [Streptomyces pseudogriseolus]|nr:hypothetical protein GCM10010233_48350 [Streptomyces gancidicus]